MPMNTTWSTSMTEVMANSDFGFLGNLIPVILILGISWYLSKKPRDMMFIQLPFCLAFKLIFPFLHVSIILLSFALFIMNLIGSKGDLLADVKETPTWLRDKIKAPTQFIKARKQAFQEDQKRVFENLKDFHRNIK